MKNCGRILEYNVNFCYFLCFSVIMVFVIIKWLVDFVVKIYILFVSNSNC